MTVSSSKHNKETRRTIINLAGFLRSIFDFILVPVKIAVKLKEHCIEIKLVRA